MKKFILFLFGLCLSGSLSAQTRLYIGSECKNVEVEEVSDTHVKYRITDLTDGPLYTTSTDKIDSVVYANGMVERFGKRVNELSTTVSDPKQWKVGDIYNMGDIKGIVVDVSEDGQHGLICNIIHNYEKIHNKRGKVIDGPRAEWCNKALYKTIIGAHDEYDGQNNMQTIEKYITNHNLTWESFPKFKLCRDLADGNWYIPSRNEAEAICATIYSHSPGDVNKAQTAFGIKLYDVRYIETTYKQKNFYYMLPNGVDTSTEDLVGNIISVHFATQLGGLGVFFGPVGGLIGTAANMKANSSPAQISAYKKSIMGGNADTLYVVHKF